MSAKRAKGTAAETAIVNYLHELGFVNAERRALHGANDKGDISGLVGVMIEVKNHKTINLAQIMDEVSVQTVHAKANIGFAWIKRRGRAHPKAWYCVVRGEDMMRLLKDAGYV